MTGDYVRFDDFSSGRERVSDNNDILIVFVFYKAYANSY